MNRRSIITVMRTVNSQTSYKKGGQYKPIICSMHQSICISKRGYCHFEHCRKFAGGKGAVGNFQKSVFMAGNQGHDCDSYKQISSLKGYFLGKCM